MKFWKVGSRRLYAVRGEPKRKRKRRSLEDDSSDSGDGEDVSDLRREIAKVGASVSKILEVKGTTNWPVGLASLLQETFKCAICHSSPIQPPAIFTRCCRQILGCQACVDRWYRGEPGTDRKCPLCRCDRGLADTSRIFGLDDFLTQINGIVRHRCHITQPPMANDSDTQ